MRRNHVYKRCSCRDLRTGRAVGVRCPRLRERGHGSWYFSVELPAAGLARVRRGGFRSRVAAEQARDYLLGTDTDPDRCAVTVGQWLDLWLQTRSLGFSTHRIYAQHIRDYLIPYLVGQPHFGQVMP
jgi:hypothetical protein